MRFAVQCFHIVFYYILMNSFLSNPYIHIFHYCFSYTPNVTTLCAVDIPLFLRSLLMLPSLISTASTSLLNFFFVSLQILHRSVFFRFLIGQDDLIHYFKSCLFTHCLDLTDDLADKAFLNQFRCQVCIQYNGNVIIRSSDSKSFCLCHSQSARSSSVKRCYLCPLPIKLIERSVSFSSCHCLRCPSIFSKRCFDLAQASYHISVRRYVSCGLKL